MSDTALKAEAADKAIQLRHALEGAVTELSRSDRELWSLRLHEVALWRNVEPVSPDARAEKIQQQVSLVLDRRDDAIRAALERISTIDETYDVLRRKSVKAEETVAAARSRFARAEAEVERRTVEDPSIVAIDREEARLRRIRAANANWREDLEKLIGERTSAYRSDPVFSYLACRGFGTGEYRARWPISVFDAKLARWSKYEQERANMQAVIAYPDEYARTMDKLEAALSELEPARQLAVRAIKDSLDPERDILADALNAAAAVVTGFDEARAAKATAFKRIEDSIGGADAETKMVIEAVVALLARERAAATLRAREAVVRAMTVEVDGLVKKRIAVAREADVLRRRALDLLKHLTDIQALLDEAAERDVGSEHFEFAIVSAGAAMA